MPAVAASDLTGDPYVDGLLTGVKWGVDSLTLSFPALGTYYEPGYGLGEPREMFGQLNATQQAVARASFTTYASVADLQFSPMTETPKDHADLRLALSDRPGTAWAYYPNTSPEGGDVWFNNSSGVYVSPVKGNYAHATFVHEIGHALGLEHPHSGNAMPVDRDSLEYTVMSYRSYVGASTSSGYTNETWGYPQSPMMYDIAALQHMYGPNYDTNSGNTTYAWSPATGEMFIDGVGQGAPGANRIFLTVWDGGGADTYDFSNYATDLDIDLHPGQWSTTSTGQLAKLHFDGSQVAPGNIANALLFDGHARSLIEKAKGGSGDDAVTGNSAANILWGHDGDDDLYGLAGNDALLGGNGNDRLYGQHGQDRLYGGVGHDVLDGGGGGDVLAGQSGHDRLYGQGGDDVLKGGDGHDVMFGGPGRDRLYGHDGDDRLYGGAGRDALVGGHGSDRLHGQQGDDRLYGGGGHDIVNGRAGDDRLAGGRGNDVVTGGRGDDAVFGGRGNDVLLGGMGRDLLVGGPDADRFVFRDTLDSPPSPGRDIIRDFSRGEGDRIVLRPIDADVTTAAEDAFVFIGTELFSGTAGELRYTATAGGHAIARGDVNGNGQDDFNIVVAFTTNLAADDFVL